MNYKPLITILLITLVVSVFAIVHFFANPTTRVQTFQQATETPTAPPTATEYAPYPAPLAPFTPEPDPTWVAATKEQIAQYVATELEVIGSHFRPDISATGPFTIVMTADIYPEDAETLRVSPTKVASDSTPDVAIIFEGRFDRASRSYTIVTASPSSPPTVIPSSLGTSFQYALFVVDKSYGMYLFSLSNNLDSLTERLPQ